MKNLIFILGVLIYSFAPAQNNHFTGADAAISYQGRILSKSNGVVELISSAAICGFQFKGDSCIVSLRNIASPGDYNYVSLEIDGEYTGRLKVTGTETHDFTIVPKNIKAEWHTLRIYKATEASNGVIEFHGVKAGALKPIQKKKTIKIEFIGNSITCGMGNDLKEIPCGNGSKWYDQHNAYWSYASLTARALGADFMLSSISGAGIYRNWNSGGPTVPQQYESAYLRIDSTRKWDFSFFIPDIVTIALGTNDLSNGDGITPRLPFDSATFIRGYVKFIGTIYNHYPDAQLVLLTSPMINDERSEILYSCLQSVKNKSVLQYTSRKEINVFRFSPVPSTGCAGHPTIKEHKIMADQLIPFVQKLVTGL